MDTTTTVFVKALSNEEWARVEFDLTEEQLPSEKQREKVQEALALETRTIFSNPDLREYVEKLRKQYEQIIDTINLDEVEQAGWDTQAREKAEALVQDFEAFIEANKDEITALSIIYNQLYHRRPLTYQAIKDLAEIIRKNRPNLAPEQVWKAYEQLEQVKGQRPENQLTALVALLRRVAGLDDSLTAYEETVKKKFQDWVFREQAGPVKFNEEQMAWLRMIRDRVAASVSISMEDLDYAPFDAKGGVGKMHQLFGQEMNEIIEEMNEALAA